MNDNTLEIQFTEHEFYHAVNHLTEQIQPNDRPGLQYQPDFVIGVAKGGVPLGQELADELDTEYREIAAQSYKDHQQQGEVEIIDQYLDEIEGKILIADDMTHTGQTMETIIHLLEGIDSIDEVRTAVIHHRPEHSIIEPHYHVEKIFDKNKPHDIWIVYDWEDPPGETRQREKWFKDMYPPATDVDIF